MIEASLEHVGVWRSANRLYPQSQNGFAGILGPHIIRDLFNMSLSLEMIGQLMIPEAELNAIIDEADAIHGRLGIICHVASGVVNQQWRATGRRILDVLSGQVEEIALATGDKTLQKMTSERKLPYSHIEYFIDDSKYFKDRKLVQSMWDIASNTIQSGSSKKKAAKITRTLISMHIDMLLNKFGLDLRQSKIIEPQWELIRSELFKKLASELSGSVEFDTFTLNDHFTLNLIRGNKPQTATRKA